MGPGTNLLAAMIWPALFWGGAAAMSVPVIIHILARRRFKRIRWAAIEFLLQAERQNRRRVKLEDLILLLLRCLAVLLIGLLVARPFFQPQGLAAMLGGSERTERIFVLDDSYSMGYQAGDGTVFDRGRQAVTRLVKQLREQSPNDTVTVLRSSAMQNPVAQSVFLNDEQTDDLFERIEGLKVSESALSSRDMVAAVGKLLDEQAGTISASLYVISDFQRKDWIESGGESENATASPMAELANWGGDDRELRVVLVDVGELGASNVAIGGLKSLRSRFVAGVSGDVEARVANFSERTTDSLNLDVTIGAAGQPTVALGAIEPAGQTSVPIPVVFTQAGFDSVTISKEADALPADDARTLVIESIEAIRILIVNGEPSSDAYRDEVTLLRTALRPSGEVFSGNEVEVIDETQLDTADLTGYDVVFLANVYRVSEPTAEALSGFVGSGGGLAIFLGDQVDPDFYNETLYRDGRGVLPLALGERTTAPASGTHLAAVDRLHPIVRIFGGRNNPFIGRISFDQYFKCLPEKDDLGDDESFSPRATVIASYDDRDAVPAIVERRFGDGRVILVTSSVDQEWNDWAKDASYVVTMLEMGQYLARGEGANSDLLIGDPIRFAVDPARYERDVLVRTPRYPAEQEVPVTAQPAEDGQGFELNWDQTDESGVYRFVIMTTSGEQDVWSVAINLDPEESNLVKATESELKQRITEVPITYVAGVDEIGQVGEDAQSELWRSVLMMAMVVLMGEQFLAWWFGRRS